MREDKLHLVDCVPGAVVFARIEGFPWWPDIIGRRNGKWRDDEGRHWVFFFGDDEGAWLSLSYMRVYSNFNQEDLLKVNGWNKKHDKS